MFLIKMRFTIFNYRTNFMYCRVFRPNEPQAVVRQHRLLRDYGPGGLRPAQEQRLHGKCYCHQSFDFFYSSSSTTTCWRTSSTSAKSTRCEAAISRKTFPGVEKSLTSSGDRAPRLRPRPTKRGRPRYCSKSSKNSKSLIEFGNLKIRN